MQTSSFVVPGKSPVSRLVFGTLRLHETDRPYALLDEAWRLGIRAFDTARVYGGGECERILGEWLRGATYRDDTLCYDPEKAVERRRDSTVVTKGGCGDGATLWRPDLAPTSLKRELMTSVDALGGIVDVYVLHRDEVKRDIGEICRTMQQFIDQGLIAAWGVSNWNIDRLEDALSYARQHHLTPPCCSSLQDSLARPAQAPWPGTVFMDDRQRKWYARHRNVAVLGWETLGKGFLAGRWDRNDDVERVDDIYSDAWREMRLKAAYLTDDNFRRRDRAATFARAKGDFRPEHVAIAWCLAQEYESHVITATVNPDHLRTSSFSLFDFSLGSNVRALSLQLSSQDVEWLTAGSPTATIDIDIAPATTTRLERVR